MEERAKIKITDDETLRGVLSRLAERADDVTLFTWAIALSRRIFDAAGVSVSEISEAERGYAVGAARFCGKSRMYDVRLAGFALHALAKSAPTPRLSAAYRVAGHAVATAHMREHAMVAADYAIKYVNLTTDPDTDTARRERLAQTESLSALLTTK